MKELLLISFNLKGLFQKFVEKFQTLKVRSIRKKARLITLMYITYIKIRRMVKHIFVFQGIGMFCGNFTEPVYLRSPKLMNELTVSLKRRKHDSVTYILHIAYICLKFVDTERYFWGTDALHPRVRMATLRWHS